jgi:uncharacterized protein YbaR (Trm112 family)
MKNETKLLNCPFCKDGQIYKIQRENELGTIIPQLFCNSCKMIFEVENDSPYLHDGKTYDYLEEKLYKTFNTRVPMERILKRLEEKAKEYTNDDLSYRIPWFGIEEAIEILKEEGGIK